MGGSASRCRGSSKKCACRPVTVAWSFRTPSREWEGQTKQTTTPGKTAAGCAWGGRYHQRRAKQGSILRRATHRQMLPRKQGGLRIGLRQRRTRKLGPESEESNWAAPICRV